MIFYDESMEKIENLKYIDYGLSEITFWHKPLKS